MTESPQWRKSTFSSDQGNCVEVAEIAEEIAVRNSNHPGRGMLTFPTGALAVFVTACSAGEFDDLA